MSGKSRRGFSEGKARYGAPRAGSAGAAGALKRRLPEPEFLPDGTIRYFLVLGPKGRVLLPAGLREGLGLGEGDIITAWLKEGEVRMHSHLRGLRDMQDGARPTAAGKIYASDELIAERRAENARDEMEALQWQRGAKKKKGRS